MATEVWVATAPIYLNNVRAYNLSNIVPDSVVTQFGLEAENLVERRTVSDTGVPSHGVDPATQTELDNAIGSRAAVSEVFAGDGKFRADKLPASVPRTVNGKTPEANGDVVLSPADVGALPSSTTASDLGALPSTTRATDIGGLDQTSGDARYPSKGDLVGLTATATRYPGLDLAGVADSSSALQAWLNAIPDGGTGVLPPGTYRASGLSVTGKSVTLNLQGARFIQAANATLLRLKGAWDATIGVTAIVTANRTVNGSLRDQAQLTLATAPAWTPGDVIRVFSDDVIPEARPGSGGSESRAGEFATVFEVSGTTVYLSGPLRDTYATNMRAARLQPVTFTVNGFTAETPDAGMATWTATILDIDAAQQPRINGLTIRQGGAIGVLFRSCYGYEINGVDIRYLNNNPSTNQFGYGVLDNSSEGGLIDAPLVRNVRHAFTDDTPRIVAGNTDPSQYGRSRAAVIRNGRAFGSSGAAWDTHHAGEGHIFIGCVSVGCEGGHNFRGRNHRVIDSNAVNCRTGYGVFAEPVGGLSYGHSIESCITTGAVYEAVVVTNETRDGRLTVTITGGSHAAKGRALRLSKVKTLINGGVEFPTRPGPVPSSSPLVLLQDSELAIDRATLNLSRTTSGGNLWVVNVADATSSVTGRNLTLALGGAASRVTAVFKGDAAAPGTATVDDVRADVAPVAYLVDMAPASRINNRVPAPPMFIYATDMASLGGNPSIGWVGADGPSRINAFMVDATTGEDVGCARLIPNDWDSVDITLIWTNTAAATGDVQWMLNRAALGDGDDSSAKTATTVLATAPVQGILKYTPLATGVTVSDDKVLLLRIRRDAANVADTLANDAGIVGVVLRRTT